MASWCNQGQLQPLTTRSAIPRDFSFYGCYISVTHSHRFLAVFDHCHPAAHFNVTAYRAVGRPVLLLPNLTSRHKWIRRAQVKVGLINLCKGLFSLNARIYYKLKSGT